MRTLTPARYRRTADFPGGTYLSRVGTYLFRSGDVSFSCRDVSFSRGDVSFSRRDVSFSRRDVSFAKKDIFLVGTDPSFGQTVINLAVGILFLHKPSGKKSVAIPKIATLL